VWSACAGGDYELTQAVAAKLKVAAQTNNEKTADLPGHFSATSSPSVIKTAFRPGQGTFVADSPLSCLREVRTLLDPHGGAALHWPAAAQQAHFFSEKKLLVGRGPRNLTTSSRGNALAQPPRAGLKVVGSTSVARM
jgi:hypothetical protein